MNFLFHTLSLTSSGGSRVIINLSNYLAENGHNIAIIIDRNRIAFPVHKNVKIYHLTNFKLKDVTPAYQGDTDHFQSHIKQKTEKKSKQKKLKLRDKYPAIQSINEWKKYLLKLLTFPSKYFVMKDFLSDFKPDKIASHNMYYFLEHYFFYPKDKLQIVLHNSPKQVFIDRTVKSILPISSFFKNRVCVGVSKGVSEEMKSIFPVISSLPSTVYNPLDFEQIRRMANDELPDFYKNNQYIVTVSSLAPGKRIERTIHSFSMLNNKDIYLVILGSGEEEKRLRALCDELQITERVMFLGFIENPLPYMKHARLLSFTSDYEGLGLVLVEALACGTPVISTDCPHGPSEILTGSLSSFLVPINDRSEENIHNDLSSCMEKVLRSKVEIDDSLIEKFDRNYIVKQWEHR